MNLFWRFMLVAFASTRAFSFDLQQSSSPSEYYSPDDLGPFSVSMTTQTIELPLKTFDTTIFKPLIPDTKPIPIIVFLHAFASGSKSYESYGSYLASHGFFVVMPSIKTNILKTLNHVQLAKIQLQINDWIEKEVNNKESLIFGANSELLGVGGHSRGGKLAIYAATLDSRIKASFNLDPVDTGNPFWKNPEAYPSTTPEMMGSLNIPVGYIGGGRSHEGHMGVSCAPLEDNFHQFFLFSKKPAYEYTIWAAAHHDFMEECNWACKLTCPSGNNKAFTQWLSKTLMVSFYKVHLLKDLRYEPWLHKQLEQYKTLVRTVVK